MLVERFALEIDAELEQVRAMQMDDRQEQIRDGLLPDKNGGRGPT